MARIQIEAQEKIIAVTTELIREHGDHVKITVREIAERSGVGTGLINYHFQTKDNLIAICVQRIVSKVIDNQVILYKNLKMSDGEKLRYVFKSLAKFMVDNPGISRLSMLADLSSASTGDNTDQTRKAHFEELNNIWGKTKTRQEIFIILHMLTSSMQCAFLRSDTLKENTGIDFYDKEQREKFVDTLFDLFTI